MKKFKYDVTELLSCIRERPCLWDKTLDNYKDRIERRTAWEEIFNILDGNYEHMSKEEQRLMGEGVIYKWTNIRDTFMKSLKTKLGKQKRRYMLHNELIFLKKNLPNAEYNDDDAYMKHEVEDTVQIDDEPIVAKKPRKSDDTKKDSRKRSKRHDDEGSSAKSNSGDDLDHEKLVESDPRVMNEDEAFFASLLPTVVRYDEDDKLEFRLGVLELMKRIRDKKWTILAD